MKKIFRVLLIFNAILMISSSIYGSSTPKKITAKEMTKSITIDHDDLSTIVIPKNNLCCCLVTCLIGATAFGSPVQAQTPVDGDSYQPACNNFSPEIPKPYIVPSELYSNPSGIHDEEHAPQQKKALILPAKSTEKELLEWYFNLGYINELNYNDIYHLNNIQYCQGTYFQKQEHLRAYVTGMLAAERMKTAEWYANLKMRIEYEKSQKAKGLFVNAAKKHQDENKKNQ